MASHHRRIPVIRNTTASANVAGWEQGVLVGLEGGQVGECRSKGECVTKLQFSDKAAHLPSKAAVGGKGQPTPTTDHCAYPP